MSRNRSLKIVNLGLLLSFILVVTSATLHMLRILGGELYGVLHVLPGIAMAFFGIIHMALNSGWIKVSYFGKGK